jgi:hypothetical protein
MYASRTKHIGGPRIDNPWSSQLCSFCGTLLLAYNLYVRPHLRLAKKKINISAQGRCKCVYFLITLYKFYATWMQHYLGTFVLIIWQKYQHGSVRI